MLKSSYFGCMPTKGSKHSAAIDLNAREDVVIGAGETVKVPLGVFIDIDIDWYMGNKINKNPTYGQGAIDAFEDFMKSHYFELEPRSGMRLKGITAGTGIIDLDYKDEICIVFHNLLTFKAIIKWIFSFGRNKSVFKISKGDKIAQILLKEHKTYLMGIDTQEERIGGFGSTDKK
jgi:dUTPase